MAPAPQTPAEHHVNVLNAKLDESEKLLLKAKKSKSNLEKSQKNLLKQINDKTEQLVEFEETL